ncbi:cytochrome P450 [Hyaloraphidium curvatum]|nr:cytochrome P450 [Hyaloraphidium curvatum]
MLGTLLALAANPTTWLVAAVAFLVFELYRRTYIDCYNDDAKTVGYIPFWHWPDPTRLKKNIRNELEYLVKHGQVVRFVNYFAPSERMIIVSDPEVMREIYLGRQWQDFDRAHRTLDLAQLFAGGLILIPNGDKWKEARDLFGRTFTNTTVRTYYPILRKNLDVFMEEIGKKARSGLAFNIQRSFTCYTFDTIARLAFGEDLYTQRGGDNLRYVEAWENLLQFVGLSILVERSIGKWAVPLTGMPQKAQAAADLINGIVLRNIERRKRGEDLDRFSIFDDAMAKGVPDWMLENNNKELLKQLMTFLFAGHDTTASMLSFMVGELATRPEWQKAIRDEVVEAFGDGETSLEKLESCKALNAVMKETLRLYPAAPHGGQRTALHDFDFKWTDRKTGQTKTVHFKEGDLILPSVYITNHHPENWPKNPESFDPQRWMEDPNGGSTHMFSWVPFGGGPRRCLGERLALNEGRLVIAELVRAYKIVPGDDWQLDIDQAGMLIPAGVRVKLVPHGKA